MNRLIFVLLGCMTMAGAEEFVIKKQKKTPMKISCGQELKEGLAQAPEMLKLIGTMLDDGFALAEAMFEDTLFATATKQQLADAAKAYEEFNARQETIKELLQEQANFLRTQKKKYLVAHP